MCDMSCVQVQHVYYSQVHISSRQRLPWSLLDLEHLHPHLHSSKHTTKYLKGRYFSNMYTLLALTLASHGHRDVNIYPQFTVDGKQKVSTKEKR